MPGVSPPTNFPTPPQAPGGSGASIGVSPSFGAGPPILTICGLSLPLLAFLLGLKIKIPGFPPPLPFPFLAISLNCSLDNPFNVSAGVSYGGGRQATYDQNPDDDAT